MNTQSSGSVIAKNTTFLYIQMMITMVVTLFTSRVILDKLGVDDYGIYQAVAGVVGLLGFLNGSLATGASRFLTFALGEGDEKKLRMTFSTILVIHLALALIIAIFSETVGLWFVYNKLVIAPERMGAAIYAYHLSVIASFFTLIQVPYNATIIANEKMSVFAYVSIFDVIGKLAICYMLTIGDFDKLKVYATLYLLIQMALPLFYVLYCSRHFMEARLSLYFDRTIAKDILGFSGWSLFAHGALALNSQGVLILINMFFSPAIVSARAISIQVYMAATQFVNNFRTAVNPQIVKRLASGDVEGSHQLLLTSTRYSYYLMLILCLPLFLLVEQVLNLWLKEVPEYTVIFTKLILIQCLFQVFDTAFYTSLYAMGRLRENALISPTVLFIQFPVIYILFKMGFSPVALSWASLFSVALLALVVKPLLLVKIAKYTWKDVVKVFWPCFYITILSLPLPIYVCHIADKGSIGGFCYVLISSILCVSAVVWICGIDRQSKQQMLAYAKNKLSRSRL